MKQAIRLWMTLVMLLACAGCNLSRTETAELPTAPPDATEQVAPRATRTPIPFGTASTSDGDLPTLLPLPGGISVTTIATSQPTLINVTSAPAIGSTCQIYTTYSGADPRNSLSLRTSASINAPQVFRVPTNNQVLLVPNSQETQGDGYHWLNVIFVDKETRYVGWMARDSFTANGVRDPSIATLRPAGTSSPC